MYINRKMEGLSEGGSVRVRKQMFGIERGQPAYTQRGEYLDMYLDRGVYIGIQKERDQNIGES